MADFFVDKGGIGDGLGDFVAEELAVALAKTMGRDFDGRFGHVQPLGDGGVRRMRPPYQHLFEGGEDGSLAAGGVFVAQAGENKFEDGKGPAAFVDAARGSVRWRVRRRSGLRREGVEGEGLRGSTTFGGVGLVPLVGEEVLERGQEEGAEFAFGAIDGGEGVFFNEAGEESLNKVFGFSGRVSLAAEVSVEREPIKGGEFAHGTLGGGASSACRRLPIAGGEDDAPAGGGEGEAWGRGWSGGGHGGGWILRRGGRRRKRGEIVAGCRRFVRMGAACSAAIRGVPPTADSSCAAEHGTRDRADTIPGRLLVRGML